MNDLDVSDLASKINDHDRHLDTLSSAVEGLANTASTTNGKLDKLVDAISSQNVLAEKVANMDHNIIDSFARRDARIASLEEVQKSIGCSKVQLAKESIGGLGRSIDTIRDELKGHIQASTSRMENIEDKISTFISGGVVRWSLGILVTMLAASYAVSNAKENNIMEKIEENAETSVRLDKLAVEKIHMQRQINKNNEDRFKNNELKIITVKEELDTHVAEYIDKKENIYNRILKIETKVSK